MKKICVITTTRAEYGLLYWLMKGIQSHPDLDLQLVVTGTHLSAEFGSTIDRIRDDGFRVDRSFDLNLHSDKAVDITQSLALGLNGFATAFNTLKPDLIVVLGDRFEIMGAALAALLAKIPVAHLHGGELSFGALDESIRHAVTKLSHLHFAATEVYRRRIIQMGENPRHVFNVGGMGIDNIRKLKLLKKHELERAIGFTLGQKNLLVTYHPETLGSTDSGTQMDDLLAALDERSDLHCIITFPNADPGHRPIIDRIEKFSENNSGRVKLIPSMGQLNYLSAMKLVDAVVGNSSSGIIEAPSFRIGTINIGHRQDGRIRAASVIDCVCRKEDILAAIKKLYSPAFRQKLSEVENPYGKGGAADKIIRILAKTSFGQLPVKKFFDLHVSGK